MDIGSIVIRKKYNGDIIFKILNINNNIALLSGVFIRIIADAPISDLNEVLNSEFEKNSLEEINYKNRIVEQYKGKIDHITGKILHYDSDNEYLNKCLDLYKSIGIYANGILSKEELIKDRVLKDINKYRPNIVIITGHDSFNGKDKKDLNNYKNSIHFMNSVLKIREKYSLDDIYVFAGACSSNLEAIIASGANSASSINREKIEAYDPALVAILAAITPINQIIDILSISRVSKLKKVNIGGVESYGKMRLLVR